MNVKLLNVKYSPNVGDGLLVDCLEAQLQTVDEMQATSSVDLAGRTDFSSSAVHREKMMRVLESVPVVIRPHLARIGLSAKLALGLRSHYRLELADADAVVLGGGNLLSDQDLNFPMKIVAALGEATRRKARVAIYGCGVASTWSRAGRAMVCKALAANPPVFTAVRDNASKKNWDHLFGAAAGAEARVVHDPGILASSVHRFAASDKKRVQPMVAIGVMSSIAIRYHGFDSLSAEELERWYLKLVDEMIDEGFDVSLFTNGSPEDQRFADSLWASLEKHPSLEKIRMVSVYKPVDLCRVIFMADAVVAFRMHALIAAYSYGKPFVALKWDSKVEAFLKTVNLEKNVLDVSASTPKEVCGVLVELLHLGVDQNMLDKVMAETRMSINSLASTLQRQLI